MLKKIAILLFILLIVQMVLYARLYANDLLAQTESISSIIKRGHVSEGADSDVQSYLQQLGISTRVDEVELEEKYQGVHLSTDQAGNTTIRFYNPQSHNYRLDIYSVSKGLVASYVNLSSEQAVLNKSMFDSGAYLFKLTGDSNLYCGTMILQ